MPQTSKTFRIFVSSTFSDLKEERDALQRDTFPRLREYCMGRGCRFQAIDLRWGVSAEASRDQRTMRICSEELRRSQEISPRPNFIVLLGDRYGWRPLPEVIPAEEFEEIEKLIEDEGDRKLLDEWYERDDNAVSPEYFLRPRELKIPKDATPEERKRLETEEAMEWGEIEERLIPLLREAASQLDLEPEARTKYITSATEQEIENGAMSPPENVPDASDHAFCFFRTLEGLPYDEERKAYDPAAKDYLDIDDAGKPDPGASQRLETLKQRLRDLFPEEKRGGHVFEYQAEWKGSEEESKEEEKKGQKPPITAAHIEKLCEDVYGSLSRIISEEIEALESVDDMEREAAEHEKFRQERSEHFTGRASMLAAIAEYITRSDPHPLAIWGEGGSGKSALAAYAISQAKEDHPSSEMIYRFIGATPSSSDIRSLLESLCHQINGVYGGEEEVPSSYEDLVDDFPKRLALATAGRPLVLCIDSLDQLSEANNAKSLVWLPGDIPENVRIIVTTRPGEELAALRNKLPEENVQKLEPMPLSEGEELLDKWLADARRTLKDHQRREVLAEFKVCGNPLYLKMAFEEARRWTSSKEEIDLKPDVVGIIRDLYERLSDEGNHGEVLTSRALGYLAASRYGLSEDEIMDVLSRDTEVMDDFRRRSPNSPEVDTLPVAVWSRFYLDLSPYLAERISEGATLLAFYHRELGGVAEEDYLPGDEGKERHRSLAEYFGEQPLIIDEEGGKPNLRKLLELPYEQANGHLWDGLRSTLTDFEFLQAKVSAVGPHPLIEDYDLALAAGYKGNELTIIRESLDLSVYVLLRDASQLAGQLVGRLMTQEALEIQDLVEQAKGWKGAHWLCPLTPALTQPGGPLIQTLEGHTHSVAAVEVTPDGLRIVSGSADKTLRVWDLDTGIERHRLSGHKDGIEAIVITRDGYAISASHDCTLKIWDINEGVLLKTLTGHRAPVVSLILTPDGQHVVSGSIDKDVIIWNIDTGKPVEKLSYHKNPVCAMEVTADGMIISASLDGMIVILDSTRRKVIHRLSSYENGIFAMALSQNGERLVTGSGNGSIQIWDIVKGVLLKTLRGHKDRVTGISSIAHSQRFVSTSVDCTVKVWDLEAGEALRTLGEHSMQVWSIAVTPDGKNVLSASMDRTVKVWRLEQESRVPEVTKHTEGITAVAYLPDKQQLVITTRAPDLMVWDLSEKREVLNLVGHKAGVLDVAVIPDRGRALSASHDGRVLVWDLEDGTELLELVGHTDSVWSVAATPDGKRAISGSKDQTLRVWDLQWGKELHCLHGHVDWVLDVAVTTDGRYAISASKDRTLRIWDIDYGKEVDRASKHEEAVWSVTITPNGRWVISGSLDGTIKVWELVTFKDANSAHLAEIYTLSAGGWILDVEALVDNTHIISTSHNGEFKLWDINARELVAAFSSDEALASCTSLHDVKTFVAGGSLGQLYLLKLKEASQDKM